MKVELAPGLYVVAVSGGVDSMVLLDILSKQPELQLVVAHFDHGVRTDSHKDRELVEQHAAKLNLPFMYETAHLGPNASEEQAREARYGFLQQIQKQVRAQAIVTAHHQDDVVETMILNMHRGTGRRGLSSLKSTEKIQRPLLGYTKNELLQYAKEQGIIWREDSTNTDPKYARNHLRLHVLPKMPAADKARLLEIQHKMKELNQEIDAQVEEVIQTITDTDGRIVRKQFVMLPHAIAMEVGAAFVRRHQARNLSRKLIARVVVAIKTARPHTTHDIDATWILAVSAQTANIMPRDARKNS